ncbi:MAG TPA: ABC-2 family transporter protein [Caulobacteraceae bacterium]|jgi:ABC-2 type transport system permease protein|nr:ABC-2 family transporter protein [Caulobacteraceae bacterium]
MDRLILNYAYQAWAAVRTAVADRTNFVLQAGGMVLNNGFFLLMWFMFFKGFRSVGGWSGTDVALLLGVIMVIVGIAGVVFGGYRDMAATILSGEVDALLTQPKSVLGRLLSHDSIPSAAGDFATAILVLAGFSGLNWTQVPLLILMIAVGLVVYLAATVTFGSLAFWARGARSLSRDLADFMIMVSSYPGSIFTGPSRWVVFTVLPAGFVVLTPVKMLREPSLATLGVLIAALAGYVGLALVVFKAGLDRYRRGAAPVT